MSLAKMLSKCFAACLLAIMEASKSEDGEINTHYMEVRVQLQHLRAISSSVAWVCSVKKSLDLL